RVAASSAHGLVNDTGHFRVGQSAPFARAALFGRAPLVVHERGDAGDVAEQPLRLVEPVAVPDFDTRRPQGALGVLVGLVGHHDDALDTFGRDRARQLGYGHGAGRVLPPP